MAISSKQIPLSPETTEALKDIIEKEGLGPTKLFGNEKLMKKLSQMTEEERLDFLKNRPLERLQTIARDIIMGKIPVEGLTIIVEKRLNVPEAKADRIAHMTASILFMEGKLPKKGEPLSEKETEEIEEAPTPEKKGLVEEELAIAEEKSREEKDREKKSGEEDTYREPVE